MKSLDPLLSQLATIPDPRRAEGKIYKLPYVLLFSILAIVTGANSYRGIRTFIEVHRRRLNKAFNIKWKRPPAHTAIRYILQGLKGEDVEKVFRDNAAGLNRVGAHIEIDEKSNEIPAVQRLLEELDVAGHIVTCDAMHCQKKPSRRPSRPTPI